MIGTLHNCFHQSSVSVCNFCLLFHFFSLLGFLLPLLCQSQNINNLMEWFQHPKPYHFIILQDNCFSVSNSKKASKLYSIYEHTIFMIFNFSVFFIIISLEQIDKYSLEIFLPKIGLLGEFQFLQILNLS